MTRRLALDPDRLFPSDPVMRGPADRQPARPYRPGLVRTDAAWTNATELLLAPDHYLYRMLYSQGVPLERRSASEQGGPSQADPREAWRLFAEPLPPVPRHAFAHVARPCLRRSVRHRRGARARDRRPLLLRPDHEALATPAFRPARAVRAVQHRASRHHRRAARGPRPPRGDPPLGLGAGGWSRPTARTR
jgi:hypothetical protein